MRVHTGANMASAKVKVSPNRHGPLDWSRHSLQMVSIRSRSARAPAHNGKPGWEAFRFMGSAERRLAKPDWISPETDRHLARSAVASASRPRSGTHSWRYSAMALVL